MWWISNKTFNNHTKSNEKQFKRGRKEFRAIQQALENQDIKLSEHNTNVDEKHEINVAMITTMQSQVGVIQATLDEIVKIKPDIEAGVKADQEWLQRRTRWRTAFTTGISVLVIISGLIPLFLWLSSLKISIHQGG